MDKQPKQTNKITVKINGEEKPLKENLVIHNWQQAKREVAATSEETNNESSYKQLSTLLKKKHNRKPRTLSTKNKYTRNLKSSSTRSNPPVLIMAIASAITVGVLIGLVLLKIMVKDSATSEIPPTTGQEQPVTGKPSEAGVTHPLPELDFVILQAGYFSNLDSVDKLKTELKQKGIFAASIQEEDSYRVFVAVVNDLAVGKKLREIVADVELWPKEVGIMNKEGKSLTKDEIAFLELSSELFGKLTEEMTMAYTQGEKYVFSESKLSPLLADIDQLKEIKNKQVEAMRKSLQQTIKNLKQFNQGYSQESWLQAQASLIQFLEQYDLL
ncbi:SPOR domain-containing protein [Bacillus kwashiorkori]|uniref:SPOR domain-containing protein n=1 Tax=Bacillus kwashiorkori TaxID=1522318 RepID=UPI0007849FD7|nr:SPOR domain-containing protein [Bacillus kwashiorkori]